MATAPITIRTKRSQQLLAGLFSVLLLGACSASGGGVADKTTTTGETSTSAGKDTTTTERETTTTRRRTTTTERETTTSTTEPKTKTGKFGDTYTFDDGLTVTIGNPFPFTPSDYVLEDNPTATYLAFDVKITNGSPDAIDPVFLTTLQSGSSEADSVYDSANGLGGGPNGVLLTDRSSTFRIGYAVSDATDLVMTVSVDFDHRDVIYTS